MIKTNELRLGNYVNHRGGKPAGPFKVAEIKKTYFSVDHVADRLPWAFNPEDCEGIPLSVEVFSAAGFGLDIHSPTYQRGNIFVYLGDRQGFGVGIRGIGLIVYVKYLHELQNIYFALTGEDLEIKF